MHRFEPRTSNLKAHIRLHTALVAATVENDVGSTAVAYHEPRNRKASTQREYIVDLLMSPSVSDTRHYSHSCHHKIRNPYVCDGCMYP